jgi:hypothetical protein
LNFFPTDPKKYRPAKLVLQIDVLREMDRAIQEGLGGFTNRHELANELIEQGLINLRYPAGDDPVELSAKSEAEAKTTANGSGDSAALNGVAESPAKAMRKVAPLTDIGETRIEAPTKTGAAIENELAVPERWPLFGMHNRDAPTAWALARLAAEASDGPILLSAFYEKVTDEAWTLAAQLEALDTKGAPKLAVMLPRNPDKPQSATEGFRAFALGGVARKPNDQGKLAASGPFYQWGAVAIVGDIKEPKIGLTATGWELIKIFDGLDFSLPHAEEMAGRFLAHLGKHAPADFWGFRTALEASAQGAGRVELNEYFRKRLADDHSDVQWKGSVAESVASGYVSRARAWGLIEPKLMDRKYVLTPAGDTALTRFAATSNA